MKCVICKHGETKDSTTTVTLERGETTLVIKDVPARAGVPEATVPHGDVDGMNAQIAHLLNDAAYCAAVSAALRGYAEANFSVAQVVGAYEEVLRSVRADE